MSHLFRVSARDHSAVVLMAELARLKKEEFASLKDVAAAMHLSEGYLEEISASLKKAKLIEGKQGPRGGYRLAKNAKEICLADILTALDGPIEIVDCQKGGGCPVSATCSSKNIWKRVQQGIEETLSQTKLVDVV
jgi:Rrf2 family protein